MTTEEFSNEFDTLIGSYTNQQTFGYDQNSLSFDEYEKSIFLTKAQEQVVEGLYTGKLLGDSFEDTEQLRRYLAPLVKTKTLSCTVGDDGISENSVFATLPSDLWFITYESVTLESKQDCLDGKEVQVIPITQDEYHRIKDNPFRKANSRRAFRLDISNSRVELIASQSIEKYLVRYLSRPEPIILIDLPNELSLSFEDKKINTQTNCKLNPGLHRMILEVAVNLAIRSRVPSTGK